MSSRKMRQTEIREGWMALFLFLGLFAAYHFIFGQYFPARTGTLGHDYTRVLPELMDGYFWFRSNGPLVPFWFTPSFCGGQPVFAAPESNYYSVPQLLSFFMDPLSSVYATVLIFAALGYWGFFLLLRACFVSSWQAAALGAALFMFNGFFIHRMMIGHFPFHGIMLTPWAAYFLLRTHDSKRHHAFSAVLAGSSIGYGVYSGMVHLLLPLLLATLGIASMHYLSGKRNPDGFWQRFLFAGAFAAALSAAKICAELYFLGNFPRSDYSLPGFFSIWASVKLLFFALFVSPTDIDLYANRYFGGSMWAMQRHEWEFGVTFIPLILMLGAAIHFLIRRSPQNSLSVGVADQRRWHWIVLLGVVLLLPLAANLNTHDWNAMLKQIPVIKSSSNLLRWFFIYIPLAILAAALGFDRLCEGDRAKVSVLAIAVSTLVFLNATADRAYYEGQSYRPGKIVSAWTEAHGRDESPVIRSIGAVFDAHGNILLSGDRNDLIAQGISQIACYNPMFGYRLERFPVGTLHVGPIIDQVDGVLNIKNPACYVFPEQNGCRPGDHFRLDQRDAAIAFAAYKPFPFEIPIAQLIANGVTLSALILLILITIWSLATKFKRLKQFQ